MHSGLDRISENPELTKDWGRCSLVANQASVTKDLIPAWKVLQGIIGDKLVSLMGPQHGFESTVQENMIETGHGTHLESGLPTHSLYSETREPTEAMLANVDTIVFDLQVTGCRIYTYKYTLAGCLRAAKKFGKKVVVLDRPNPLGGVFIEGNVLQEDASSFVGEYPIPMRHGLTMAEAGRFFNREIHAPLEVVELTGWDPQGMWDRTGREWVLTSPNLPFIEAVYTFPGMVLFEGTNVSEGRGTCLPFLFVGAPFFRTGRDLLDRTLELMGGEIPGVRVRSASFEPGFSKWSGAICNGYQLHVFDPYLLPSYRLGLAAVRACADVGGERFEWRPPPYEYNYELPPIQLLMGDRTLPARLLADAKLNLNEPCWNQGASEFIEEASQVLLYERRQRIF